MVAERWQIPNMRVNLCLPCSAQIIVFIELTTPREPGELRRPLRNSVSLEFAAVSAMARRMMNAKTAAIDAIIKGSKSKTGVQITVT